MALPTLSQNQLEVWHKRLGHVGQETLQKTASMTEGMELTSKETLDGMCEACEVSKSVRTVSRKPQQREKHAFDKVHVDVLSVNPPSYDGHKWAVLLTDDYSRARWIRIFTHKHEAFTKVVEFITEVKKQYSRDVRKLRMDSGREYGGDKLTNYAKLHGILLEPTVPYTPEQDGVAERGIRTVLEKTRTICYDQGIPLILWSEIIQAVIRITNRTYTSAVREVTPLQALLKDVDKEDSPPSIKHLRILGCKSYVHIQKERRVQSEKLHPRAEIGILVGYVSSSIYKVWIPTRRKVVRTSTVTFDESTESTQEIETLDFESDSDLEVGGVQDSTSKSTQVQTEPLEDSDDSYEDAEEEPPQPNVTTRSKARGRPPGAKNKTTIAHEKSSFNMELRPRSSRTNHQSIHTVLFSAKDHKDIQQQACAFVLSLDSDYEEPKSYEQAMKSPQAKQWQEAMEEEMISLGQNNT